MSDPDAATTTDFHAPGFNPLQHPLALSELRYFTGESAWSGHLPFGMALVQMLRPRTIVELGTHWGDSYCAFCQAVAELKLPARCAAVDTWQGDAHTRSYGEYVYQTLKGFHDPAYGSFSRLLRMTFDQARSDFPDNSIDLLHIDGLHTYEAVRHDFDNWKPTLSERGVELFHDTMVKRADFGVWRLWQELEGAYPSFQFYHESGLGVLAVGKEPPAEFAAFLEGARREPALVRAFFAAVGGRCTMMASLMRTVTSLQAARQAVNEWRARSGRPVKPVNPEPYKLAYQTLEDVKELLMLVT